MHSPQFSPDSNSPALRKQKNGYATASLVLGIIFFVLSPLGFLGILGLVFGVVGIIRAFRLRDISGTAAGSSRAVIGLILSILAILIFSSLWVYSMNNPQNTAGGNTRAADTSAQASRDGLDEEDKDKDVSDPSQKVTPTPKQEATRPSKSPKPTKSPKLSVAEQTDQDMRAQGYNVIVSGDLYFRWLTADEKAGSSCGYVSCVHGIISTVTACPTGFYVRGDILSSGTPVGWTNQMTASARANETIVFTLEDYQGIGDSFRISELYCMR